MRRGLSPRGEAWVAISLSWAAGFVDTIGYLALHGLYTANMTGNTAPLAFEAVAHRWKGVLWRGWAIGAFTGGSVIGCILLETARRRGLRSRVAPCLSLQVVLLAGFIAAGVFTARPGVKMVSSEPVFFLMVALAAVAMAVQSVTVERVGAVRVHTTYLTGTLTRLGETTTTYLFWLYDAVRGTPVRQWWRVLTVSWSQKSCRYTLFLAGLWVAFVLGASCGAGLKRWCGLGSLLLPLALYLSIAVLDRRMPITTVEVYSAGSGWDEAAR